MPDRIALVTMFSDDMFSDDDFRLYSCARCLKLVRICRRCDRGNRYCSADCRVAGRRDCVRDARHRYQRSPRGRVLHSARQRALRQRRRASAPAEPIDRNARPQMRELQRMAFQAATGTRTALFPGTAPQTDLPPGTPRRLRRPSPVEQLDQGAQRRHAVRCSLCDQACGPFARFGYLAAKKSRRARTRTIRLVNPDPSRIRRADEKSTCCATGR